MESSPSAPRPLVFDLDGTLIDSRGDIASACNHALRASGRKQLSTDAISALVGNGAHALLQGAAGERLSQEDLATLLSHFESYYLEHPVEHNRVLPGALEALELRHQRSISLCTNKPLALTKAVLEALGWLEFFDVVSAPCGDEPKKPNPEPLLKVSGQLGVEPNRLVMIGDGVQDVGAGKAVGASTVALLGGFGGGDALKAAEPDIILENLEQLPAYLLKLGGLKHRIVGFFAGLRPPGRKSGNHDSARPTQGYDSRRPTGSHAPREGNGISRTAGEGSCSSHRASRWKGCWGGD